MPSCYNDSEDFTFWFYGEKLIPEAHKVKKIVCKSPDEADDLCIKLNEGLLDWVSEKLLISFNSQEINLSTSGIRQVSTVRSFRGRLLVGTI